MRIGHPRKGGGWLFFMEPEDSGTSEENISLPASGINRVDLFAADSMGPGITT